VRWCSGNTASWPPPSHVQDIFPRSLVHPWPLQELLFRMLLFFSHTQSGATQSITASFPLWNRLFSHRSFPISVSPSCFCCTASGNADCPALPRQHGNHFGAVDIALGPWANVYPDWEPRKAENGLVSLVGRALLAVTTPVSVCFGNW
jgi:hypothetical protein